MLLGTIIPYRCFAWPGSSIALVGSLLLLWLYPIIGTTLLMIFGVLGLIDTVDFPGASRRAAGSATQPALEPAVP